MPFLFPYLVGGAVAYILFVKKQKPCAAGDVLLTDDTTGTASAACVLPSDVVCFVVRYAAVSKDSAALATVKGWLDSGVITKEQASACYPSAKLG